MRRLLILSLISVAFYLCGHTQKSVYLCFDMYIEKKMGVVISKDLNRWEDISDLVAFPDGTRHGTVFTIDETILEKLLEL